MEHSKQLVRSIQTSPERGEGVRARQTGEKDKLLFLAHNRATRSAE